MSSLNQSTNSKLKHFDMRKNYNIPRYVVIIFFIIFLVSIIFNMKLIFFPESVPLMNFPFNAKITETDSGEITVKGLGDNSDYFKESYRILKTDEIKIVDENNQNISFEDLKPGMYVNVRVVNYDFNFKDMDTVTFVTKIKCSESMEGLYE